VSSEDQAVGLDQPSNEKTITSSIATIGAADSAFTINLARALLRTIALNGGVTAKRSKQLLTHLPRSRLSLSAEKHVPHDGLIDIWRNVHGSYIDLLFLGDQFALAVEIKTRRATRFGDYQLASYHRALTTRDSCIARPYSGLLAIAPVQPFRDELISIRRSRCFLGVIAWTEAAPELNAITPHNRNDAHRWKQILDAVTHA
jgi:hypothetical protein